MSDICSGLGPDALTGLLRDPHRPMTARAGVSTCTARIGIPDYGARLERHYGRTPQSLGHGFPFRHFGLVLELAKPMELSIHDGGRRLDQGLRGLIERFGPLIIRNARLPSCDRQAEQRNVFASLSFHIDRGRTQEDHYSLFWRDPLDPVQREPRSSTTLVLANAAAYLQALAEGHGPHEPRSQYDLFRGTGPEDLIGSVLFEIPWSAPAGVGEIALLDNRTVLHASHYARPQDKGYPISVRYLF